MMQSIGLIILGLLTIGSALTATHSHINSADLQRLESIFADGLKSNDLQSVYYSIINTKLELPGLTVRDLCGSLPSLYKASTMNEPEKNYFLVLTAQKLNCLSVVDAGIKDSIKNAKEPKSTQELFYQFVSQKTIYPLDNINAQQLVKQIQNLLKKDDSLTSLGYGFYVASELGEAAKPIFDWVESAFAQADEVDSKLLQFEGGLSTTSLVFNGALLLSSSLNKPAIGNEQLEKFTNYFLSRRTVQSPKGASVLLEALETINKQKTPPICIQLTENSQILTDSPILHIKVVDILGRPVRQAISTITATITLKPDNSVVATKVPLKEKSSDKSIYSLDLTNSKPTRGLYTAEIIAGEFRQVFNFNILGKVQVKSFEIGVGETDNTSSLKSFNLAHPNKLSNQLSADYQQKIVFKSLLTDELSGSPLTVHQAFVKFENLQSKEEIIFVAEQDSNKFYKFDMDIGARGVEFNYNSTLYSLEFIVGDASLYNSFRWYICDVNLKFSGEAKEKVQQKKILAKRPEIIHQFRQPESRPPQVVSTFFTIVCAVPLLVLFYLWIKLRINVCNFSFSLYSIGFHIGFAVILGLFGLFFLQLNMFETIRYLIPVALFTFFCGNRLLRSIAAKRSNDTKQISN